MTVRAKSTLIILLFLAFALCLAAAPYFVEVLDLPAPLMWVLLAPWGIVLLGMLSAILVQRTYSSRLRFIQHTLASRADATDIPGVLAAMPQDDVGRLAHELSACLRQSERDRRDAQQWERDAQAAQRRVGSLIEMLPVAVMVVDEQGRIVQMNRYDGRLIGWKPQDALRKPISELFPEPFHRTTNDAAVFLELRERLRRPSRNPGVVAFRAVGRSAAGVEAAYHMQVQELPSGSRIEYVCLVRLMADDAPEAPVHAPVVTPESARRHMQERGMEAEPALDQVDLCRLLDVVVDEVEAAMPESRRRIALMKPEAAMALAHLRSLHVVVREVLEAAFRAALPSAVINATVTETQDAVGLMVEAPVAMDAGRVGSPPPLVFATEVARALGGSLEVYDDIPGSLQIVVELQRAPVGSQ